MVQRVELQPAYVLHSRPYRDSSLIVTLFSRDAGRIAGVVRGGRGARRRTGQHWQPFIPLLVSFQGGGGLKTFTAVEAQSPGWSLQGRVLYSGFYLNELLMRLVPEDDPHPGIYSAYQDFLAAVHGDAAVLEPQLRQFEFALLEELGYAVPFETEAESGAPLETQCHYRFVPERGFLALPEGARVTQDCFIGEVLIGISQRQFQIDAVRRTAKRLTRLALKPLLGNKPLKSREFFTGLSSQ
ncbi:DNA repair protein RecO [Exilibacterium tricleocarpae]|uniref:DNA repair protein RecO n=1 Tax=Exilibacterium tricleocarpae TaxID=2591008 RepID=A0A545U3R0_9GAMM|nr:DNA repair protein RecO [Exilibacterium tricleocarpae]TQV84054.1 DNA repair protein RecO [Exilibacterium tricleocarpae]